MTLRLTAEALLEQKKGSNNKTICKDVAGKQKTCRHVSDEAALQVSYVRLQMC